MATIAREAKQQFISSYVSNLRSKIGYYLPYIPNEYADQVEADNFYEVLRKDSEVFRTTHYLAIAASGEKITIECDDKMMEAVAKHSVSHIKDFLHSRKSLIEKSVVFGLGLQRKYYKQIKTKSGLRLKVIDRLQEVDKRRMRFERDIEKNGKLTATLWHPTYDKYIVLEDRAENPNAPDGCAFQDYVWYRQMYEEMSPYFQGFGEVLYDICYIKNKVRQYWADLAESWAKPFFVATVDLAKAAVTAPLGDGYTSSKSRVDNILATLEKSRARHCLVTDTGDKIDVIEHGSTGSNILRELLEYLDRTIDLLILGAELSTTTPGNGSYALGSIHKAATDSFILYNRYRLGEVLDEEIIQDFFIQNAYELAKAGIGMPEDGEIRIKMEAIPTEQALQSQGDQKSQQQQQEQLYANRQS